MDHADRTKMQVQMLTNRLRKRSRHFHKWAKREGVSCYRIYDRDIPEIPLCIDWYEGKIHVAEIARRSPKGSAEPTPEEHEEWLQALIEVVTATLAVERKHVFVKRRERQRGKSQYERFDRQEASFVVHEAGLKFCVNLSDYLDTGLFLDHRPTRARVRAEAEGKRVLNLFAYTGSFTVHAAAGGARSTTTVDLSRTYLDWARRNLELNGLAAPRHRLVQANVLRYVREARQQPLRYDLIVVDPPTFSNSKRMQGHFDIRAHHGDLLRDVLALSNPDGVVYFSTNSRRFRLDEEVLQQVDVEDITRETIPADFHHGTPHRCWRLHLKG